MAKIIELFNHKGGVSKTTTTFNIAWKISEKNKKILLVDADPQCNLTGMFLGEDFDDYYENEETRHLNIKDAVNMAFKGSPNPITAIECPHHEKNNNLYLIPGHMDLSEYESSLNLALTSNNAILTLQNLPGAFYELIKKTCDKYDIDYVFIDMNPGLSAINQTFFMYADAFIVPTNPDPFSVMALKTLRKTLPRWKKLAESSRIYFSESTYPLPEAEMKFIGVIIQRFSLRNRKAAKPYTGKIEEIKKYIEGDFYKELSKHNMVFANSKRVDNHCLGEISDFGSLLQKAHEARIPVFALRKEDMSFSGNVYESMEAKRLGYDKLFNDISDVISELV